MTRICRYRQITQCLFLSLSLMQRNTRVAQQCLAVNGPKPVSENVGPVFRKADVQVANQPASSVRWPHPIGVGWALSLPLVRSRSAGSTLSVDHASYAAPAGVRDRFGTVSVDLHCLYVGAPLIIFQLVAALD